MRLADGANTETRKTVSVSKGFSRFHDAYLSAFRKRVTPQTTFIIYQILISVSVS